MAPRKKPLTYRPLMHGQGGVPKQVTNMVRAGYVRVAQTPGRMVASRQRKSTAFGNQVYKPLKQAGLTRKKRNFGQKVVGALKDINRVADDYNLVSTGLGLAAMAPTPYSPALKAGAVGASLLGYGRPIRKRRKTAVKKKRPKRKK